jgi:hypothetical protein
MRAIVAAALLLALAAACSSSAPDPKAPAARAEAGASTSVPTTTEPPASEAVSADTWRVRYSFWTSELRIALETAGALRHVGGRPVALSRLGAEEREAYEAAVAKLARCALAKLGQPPARLARAAGLLARSCAAFARGAELAAAGAPYGRSFAAWTAGAALVLRANRRVPRPDRVDRLPLPVGGGVTNASRIEPLFTAVANALAAPTVEVRCWSEPEWTWLKRDLFGKSPEIAGFALAESKDVGLSGETCRWIAALAYTRARPTGVDQLRIAFAVNVLMHESGHLDKAGDFYGAGHNEALAECWAMQHIRAAARRLGGDRSYANALAERYWAEIYPTNSPKYRSPRCRNGGPWDERPRSQVWP